MTQLAYSIPIFISSSEKKNKQISPYAVKDPSTPKTYTNCFEDTAVKNVYLSP